VDLMTRIWSGLGGDVGALASCPDCKLRTANKRRTRSRATGGIGESVTGICEDSS